MRFVLQDPACLLRREAGTSRSGFRPTATCSGKERYMPIPETVPGYLSCLFPPGTWECRPRVKPRHAQMDLVPALVDLPLHPLVPDPCHVPFP